MGSWELTSQEAEQVWGWKQAEEVQAAASTGTPPKKAVGRARLQYPSAHTKAGTEGADYAG